MIENIIYFITGLILQITWICAYKKITNENIIINFKNITIMFLLEILHLLVKLFIHYNVNVVFTFINIAIDYKLFFNNKLKKAILYSLIIWVLSIIIDLITMVIMLPININVLNDFNRQMLSSISTIIMVTFLLSLSYIKYTRMFINNVYKKIETFHINSVSISIILWSFFILGYLSVHNMGNDKILINNLVIGAIALILLTNILYLHFNIYTLKKTNKIIEKNDYINREVIVQYKTIKHNMENKLIGLKTVPNKEKEKVINEIIKEQNNSFYIKYDIEKMPRGISGLILEVIYQYKDDKINVKIDNRITQNLLSILGPKRYNMLCDVLGITLKNALEASKETKEKLILIEFKELEKQISITITNSFKGSINIDEIGELYYTTKENGNGLGLNSIIRRKTIKSTFSIKNNYFISHLTINKAN